MYNRHRFNVKFKRDVGDDVLSADLQKRQELSECKKIFSMKNLLTCREMFACYLKQCGEGEPVQKFDPRVNQWFNYALSFTHFVPTNQPYASRVKKIIDEAKENKDQLPSAVCVFNAVIEIKKIGDEMDAKHIVGRVRNSIQALLTKFQLDKNFQKRTEEIENTLKYITELDDNTRIISPIIERPCFQTR